jgi:hypothetical protein
MRRLRRPAIPFALCAAILSFLSIQSAPAAERPAADPFAIHLLQGDVTPPAGAGEASLAALARSGADLARRGERTIHALLQFERTPGPDERAALAAGGVELGGYATGNAWIAAVPADRVGSALGRSGVRWAAAWDSSRKLDPALARGVISAGARHPALPGQVKLFVHLHRDVPLDRLARLAETLGGRALDPVAGLHGGTMWIPDSRLAALAGSEDVLWVSEDVPPLRPLNDGVLAFTHGDKVQSSFGLEGKGTRIFLYDSGAVEAKHPTFMDGSTSRVKVLDGSPVDEHSTHVAGTAAGDGSDDPAGGHRGRGMAPEAKVFSAGVAFNGPGIAPPFIDNLGDLEKDYAAAADQNLDVANNSIGLDISKDQDRPCGFQGDYGPYGQAVDTIARGDDPEIARPVIVVWAAGNERGSTRCGSDFTTMAPPSCAKNSISVGAIQSDGGAMSVFSSWGPCDDGRLAPTIVAPGDESGEVSGEHGIYSSLGGGTYGTLRGTSMAAPGVTGAIALLIQDWRQQGHGDEKEQPLPALVRALVVHSARDLGPKGPDYLYGYGALDAEQLIALERADDGKLGNGNGPQWGSDSLTKPADVRTFQILVGADLPSLRATLAWDDPAASPFANPTLVNDLTLELISPSNQVFQSWRLDPDHPELPAALAGNDLDNLEQVVVENPEQGLWQVRVSAAKLPEGPQAFALVYSATPQTYEKCFGETWKFESEQAPFDWTLNGASVQAVPDGSGNHAVELAGGSEASFVLSLPQGLARADLQFRAAPFTDETIQTNDFRDTLSVELRDPATHKVLALLDQRDSAWPNEVWLEAQNIALPGGKIEVAFVAKEDGDAFKTRFFVDDVHATWCPQEDVDPHFNVDSTGGGQDGFVVESSEESKAGGTAYPASSPKQLIEMGDWSADEQVKGIVSFDTSSLPDDLTITGAVLELHLQGIQGDNPHITHALCRVDIAEGYFGDSPDLEPKDFEAPATRANVSPLGYANDPLETSYANLLYNQFNVFNPPVNKKGLTQARIYCDKDDDDDQSSDLARYYSGAAPAGLRPRLVVTFAP